MLKYSCNWSYQFNFGKTGVVVFGECAVTYSKNMKVCQWEVAPKCIFELSEYFNLGVFKNYCGSFDKNIDENITKATKKAGMLFSADFDRRRLNPMVYIKFWRQVCIPVLLFKAELWTVTRSGLEKLDAEGGFSKNFFICLTTIGSLLHQKKLYFLGRIVRGRSLFIGITGSGKFNCNFSRFSWPVHRIFKKFKACTSYHNFFQDP